MPRYYLRLILLTVFANASDTYASKGPGINDGGEAKLGAPSKGQYAYAKGIEEYSENKLSPSLPDQTLTFDSILHITRYLDPLSLSCLLLTNNALGNKIRNQTWHIKPMPFDSKLLEEIKFKLNHPYSPMDEESYMLELCQRLLYSFNPIFGAQVGWHGFLEKLPEQHLCFESFWEQIPSAEYNTALTLMNLYLKITNPENQKFSEIEQDKQNFLEDTPKRRQAIKSIRPVLLHGYLMEVLNSFFFKDANHRKKHGRKYNLLTLQNMLHTFHCYEALINKKGPAFVSPIDFNLWQFHLFHALWKAKIYHGAIGLDLIAQKQFSQRANDNLWSNLWSPFSKLAGWAGVGGKAEFQRKFQGSILSSLPPLIGYWQLTLTDMPFESRIKLSLPYTAQTMTTWFEEMIGTIETRYISKEEIRDTFRNSITNKIKTTLYNISVTNAKSQIPQTDDTVANQKCAFYCSEVAGLAANDATKIIAYDNAARSKWNEAAFLSEEPDRQKKAEAFSQSSLYYVNVADLQSDLTDKAEAYDNAANAKWEEAIHLSEETDRQKKAEAFAQSSLYYVNAANFHSDLAQKTHVYQKAADAKWNEATHWNEATDRQKKTEAYAQSSLYYVNAADLQSDLTDKAQAYQEAGVSKWNEAIHVSEGTERQKKTEAFTQAFLYFEKAANLQSDTPKKAQASQNAACAKWNEADLLSEETDGQKKAEAFGQSSLYYVNAADLHSDLAKKAQAYQEAASGKCNEAIFLSGETDLQKKAEAFAQSSLYYVNVADFHSDPAKKAQAYQEAAEVKWEEAIHLSEETERQKKAEAFAQSSLYYVNAANFHSDPAKKAQAYQEAAEIKCNESIFLSEETDSQKKAAAYAQSSLYYVNAANFHSDPAKKAQAYHEAASVKWNEAKLIKNAQRLKSAKEAQILWDSFPLNLRNSCDLENLQKRNALLWSSVTSFKLSQWDTKNKEKHLQNLLERLEAVAKVETSASTESHDLMLCQGILDSLHPQTRERGVQNLQDLALWAEKQHEPLAPTSIFCGDFSLEDYKLGSAILEDQRIKDFLDF